MDRELTFGEKAVGLTFNPSGDPQVHECKKEFAAVIDRLHTLRTNAGMGEKSRLLSVAITEVQGAQMWAVKGITWNDFPVDPAFNGVATGPESAIGASTEPGADVTVGTPTEPEPQPAGLEPEQA